MKVIRTLQAEHQNMIHYTQHLRNLSQRLPHADSAQQISQELQLQSRLLEECCKWQHVLAQRLDALAQAFGLLPQNWKPPSGGAAAESSGTALTTKLPGQAPGDVFSNSELERIFSSF